MAAAAIPVTYYLDAAIGHALQDADAVLVGADAVGPEWVLNKSGTRLLAAAAAEQGVPVYVAATRDKFIGAPVAERLVIREGAPDEVWHDAPPGIEVRNPYFEAVPLDLVTAILTDTGVVGSPLVPQVCASAYDAAAVAALVRLGS
jgi:translation initiation factor 2B subunit (eIF-2B alpha/beta/delta family)